MDPMNQPDPSLPQSDGTVPAVSQENTAPAISPQPADQPTVIAPSPQASDMGVVDAPLTTASSASESTGVVSVTNPPAVNTDSSDQPSSAAPLAEPWPGPDAVQDSSAVPSDAFMPEADRPLAAPAENASSAPEQPAV